MTCLGSNQSTRHPSCTGTSAPPPGTVNSNPILGCKAHHSPCTSVQDLKFFFSVYHFRVRYASLTSLVSFFQKGPLRQKRKYSYIRRALDTMPALQVLSGLADLTCALPQWQDSLLIWSVSDSPLVETSLQKSRRRTPQLLPLPFLVLTDWRFAYFTKREGWCDRPSTWIG